MCGWSNWHHFSWTMENFERDNEMNDLMYISPSLELSLGLNVSIWYDMIWIWEQAYKEVLLFFFLNQVKLKLEISRLKSLQKFVLSFLHLKVRFTYWKFSSSIPPWQVCYFGLLGSHFISFNIFLEIITIYSF